MKAMWKRAIVAKGRDEQECHKEASVYTDSLEASLPGSAPRKYRNMRIRSGIFPSCGWGYPVDWGEELQLNKWFTLADGFKLLGFKPVWRSPHDPPKGSRRMPDARLLVHGDDGLLVMSLQERLEGNSCEPPEVAPTKRRKPGLPVKEGGPISLGETASVLSSVSARSSLNLASSAPIGISAQVQDSSDEHATTEPDAPPLQRERSDPVSFSTACETFHNSPKLARVEVAKRFMLAWKSQDDWGFPDAVKGLIRSCAAVKSGGITYEVIASLFGYTPKYAFTLDADLPSERGFTMSICPSHRRCYMGDVEVSYDVHNFTAVRCQSGRIEGPLIFKILKEVIKLPSIFRAGTLETLLCNCPRAAESAEDGLVNGTPLELVREEVTLKEVPMTKFWGLLDSVFGFKVENEFSRSLYGVMVNSGSVYPVSMDLCASPVIRQIA